MISDAIQSMYSHIRSVPGLLADLLPSIRKQATTLFTLGEMCGIHRIILTGCGISLCVAMAAQQAFDSLTDAAVSVLDTMHLARYASLRKLVCPGTVVIIISNSGNVSRITELAGRITGQGGVAVAVTGKADSPLYENTIRQILLPLPPHPFQPDVRSFAPALAALCALAAHIGLAQQAVTPGEADAILGEIDAMPQILDASMHAMELASMAAAKTLSSCRSFEGIGSGTEYATAWFAQTKVLAACGLPVLATNAEDWFHLYYFARGAETTATCLVTNAQSPSRSRDMELAGVAHAMGRPLVFISDAPSHAEGPTIQTPVVRHAYLAPLVQHIPAAQLAVSLCDLLGETYHRGAVDKWTACHNCATLNQNEIIHFA